MSSDNLFIKPKISTMTISTQLPNCQLNLTNIGKYLDIDENIIGIKFTFGSTQIMKGCYETTIYKKSKNKKQEKINKNLFYNQISIIYKYDIIEANVKLFGNGSLHITGCKNINDGNIITNGIYDKLKLLTYKTDKILLTKDSSGIWLDCDYNIYNNIHDNNSKNSMIIGYKQQYLYNIDKKEYIFDNHYNHLIYKNFEQQRKKTILDLNGNKIGFLQVKLLKNKNKIYKNNTNVLYDYKNKLVYINDNIIGYIVYNINKTETENKNETSNISSSICEIDYNCNPFINTDYNLDNLDKSDKFEFKLNVNCINIYFNTGIIINRQRFFEQLLQQQFICKYQPDIYSGVKLLYKLNKNDDGLCKCNNTCTCLNITFLIFQSGNVIVTGLKNHEQINKCTKHFLNILSDIKHIVQKKELKLTELLPA